VRGGHMIQVKWIAVLLPAVLMTLSGCATKSWVRDLVRTNQVETNQRVDQKVDTVDQRVDTVSTQVKAVEASLGDTTQLARGANEKAAAAMTKASNAYGRRSGGWW